MQTHRCNAGSRIKDPFLYRHLSGAPAVYNTTEWDLAKLAARLDPDPVVDRNLAFEGYWQDWVDGVTGRRLNWNVPVLAVTSNMTVGQWIESINLGFIKTA